jgi:hypothetical protein
MIIAKINLLALGVLKLSLRARKADVKDQTITLVSRKKGTYNGY